MFQGQTVVVVRRRAGGRGVQLEVEVVEQMVVMNELRRRYVGNAGAPHDRTIGAQADGGTSGDPSGQELE